jgi:EAL and modified HD-GYP domain-containing signal transduction protein
MSEHNALSESIFIGRQPIFTADMDVYGYELLYRGSQMNSAGRIDGDIATTKVVLNAFLEIGLENLVGGKLAFINVTRTFIEGHIPIPFPKQQVVIEVLEDIPPEPEVLKALRELSRQGYGIALDDFVYEQKLDALIKIANIIKIDVQVTKGEDLEQHAKTLRRAGVQLLAEKVETQEEFENCRRLGFSLFQGYFLSRPAVIEGQKLPSNKIAVLQLLAKLQDPNVEIEELDELVKRDATLSYKVLKYVNSPALSLGKEVTSLQQAIMMLGLLSLKRWVMLIVLAGLSEKSDELIRIAMVRAKMCELLAQATGADNLEDYFAAGLFSTLDAMLDRPIQQILQSLPLSQPVRAALLEHKGEVGNALNCAIAYEEARWQDVGFKNFDAAQLRDKYLEATQWADIAMGGIAD